MREFENLISAPLYKEFVISLGVSSGVPMISTGNLNAFKNLIGLGKENVEGVHCLGCGKEMPFEVNTTALGYGFNGVQINNEISIDNFVVRDINAIVRINMTCLYDNETEYIYFVNIATENSNIVIKKIGQIPELYKIDNFENFGFGTQLRKMMIEKDFFDTHVMISYGYAIDTLLYIRRIIEKMVNFYLSEDEIKILRFEDKFKQAEIKHSFIDPDIIDVMNLVFKLSSDSIHSLSQEQCEEYVGPLYNFIIMQLDYMKEQDDKKNQKLDNKKMINKLFSKKKTRNFS